MLAFATAVGHCSRELPTYARASQNRTGSRNSQLACPNPRVSTHRPEIVGSQLVSSHTVSSMDLTPEQEDLLSQFMEVTQRTNRPECVAFLAATDWNFPLALNLSFDQLAGAASIPRRPPPMPPRNSQPSMSLLEELNQELVVDRAPQVSQRPRSLQVGGNLLGWLLSPVRAIIYLLGAILPRVFGYYSANRGATRAIIDPWDPKRASARLACRLEDRIGKTHLELFPGSYTEALTLAKSDLRYLLVVLFDWRNQDTASFLPWLANEDIISVCQGQNVLVWAGTLDSPEALQVGLGLGATRFPLVALIAPCPKTPQSSTVVMEILTKNAIREITSPVALAHLLGDKLENHEPKILALRLDRERFSEDRAVRAQQDSAYEASLARDRARASEREQQEAREREEQASKARYDTLYEQWKKGKAHFFDSRQVPKPSARILIRTQDNERIVANFANTDTIQTIYDYVLCREYLGKNTQEDVPADFEPRIDFKLISPMPRKVLEPSNTPIESEPILWPSGSLIIDEE